MTNFVVTYEEKQTKLHDDSKSRIYTRTRYKLRYVARHEEWISSILDDPTRGWYERVNAHARVYDPGRCRRAEVRRTSVGLNVSKALDVGARAAGVGAGGVRGETHCALLPSMSNQRQLQPSCTPTVISSLTLSLHLSLLPRLAPCVPPHRSCWGRGWNKVVPEGWFGWSGLRRGKSTEKDGLIETMDGRRETGPM